MSENTKNKKIPCQIFSRIVGYVRPLGSWNDAKKHEFAKRKVYKVPSNEQLEEEHDECPRG